MFTVAFASNLLESLPEEAFIAINICPDFLLNSDIAALLPQTSLRRIVLEITEHAAVSHYGKIADALAPLRAQGLRLVVDDAGRDMPASATSWCCARILSSWTLV